jgi:hypothetical protein
MVAPVEVRAQLHCHWTFQCRHLLSKVLAYRRRAGRKFQLCRVFPSGNAYFIAKRHANARVDHALALAGDRELDGCRPDQSAMKFTCQSRKQQPGAYGALIWLPRCAASCELGRAKERDHLKIVAEAVPQFNDNTRPCFEKRKSRLQSLDARPCPKAIIRVPPPARANANLPPAAMPIMTPDRMPVPPTVEVQVPMPARITGMAARMAVISKRRRREH